MAYYPKYKVNNKKPKAIAGAALAALKLAPFAIQGIKGLFDRKRGKDRERDAQSSIDALKESGRLSYEVPSTYREMVDEPVDQDYIEGLEDSRAANFATAMQNLSRDPRGALPVAMGMERQAAKDRLDLLEVQQTAKTAALQNLAAAEGVAEEKDVALATSEAAGLQGELASAVKQQTQGTEGIMSGVLGGLQTGASSGLFGEDIQEAMGSGSGSNVAEMFGGSENLSDEAAQEIEDVANANLTGSFEEGGTTPDEFSHDSNPIDIVQDGEKIGEMTGQEIIMPPDDRTQIEMLMEKGDGKALMSLLKELFEKYDSNVISAKETKAPMKKEDSMRQEQPMKEEEPTMMEHGGSYLSKIKNRLKFNY
tara:strand:+ start:53 stop:1150 length:1098 start_codon:yes stop_codon:yes gene_type:complete